MPLSVNAETRRTRVGELLADDRMRDRNAVELGQLVVEQRDVGTMLLDRGERRTSVLGFGHDLDLPAREQRPNHSLAVEGVVVGDDDGDPLLLWCRHARFAHRTPPLLDGSVAECDCDRSALPAANDLELERVARLVQRDDVAELRGGGDGLAVDRHDRIRADERTRCRSRSPAAWRP